MRAAHDLRRLLARLRVPSRRGSQPDAALLALTGEFDSNDRALRDLLNGDGRDTDEVPGFDDLADRQAELVDLIVAIPAVSRAGLIAKATCARLRPPEQGFDAALKLALSVSDDLLRFGGAAPSPSQPPRPSQDRPPDGSHEVLRLGKAQPVAEQSGGGRRLVILRRNELWRHLSSTLSRIGAWALGAAIVLPFSGPRLPWFVVAALLAIGAGAIALSVFCLRFIDHPE